MEVRVSGSWSFSSKSDPRWNGSGRGFLGRFIMCEGAREFLEAKKLELGSNPPSDLKWSYKSD